MGSIEGGFGGRGTEVPSNSSGGGGGGGATARGTYSPTFVLGMGSSGKGGNRVLAFSGDPEGNSPNPGIRSPNPGISLSCGPKNKPG